MGAPTAFFVVYLYSMKILFIFLDGVGLGSDHPEINPFAQAHLPVIERLLGGRKLTATAVPLDCERASLRALDARLGVEGLPQSATGQAALLTGRNVPHELGYHYGPKPNSAVAKMIANGNLFARARAAGKAVDFVNAYPPGYFEGIRSGRRMYAAIALAASSAGLRLHDLEDLRQGRALSADLTGEGWRARLGMEDLPLLTVREAGQRLARLGLAHDFSLFEYWLTDYAGHGQEMHTSVELLQTFDAMLAGLLDSWNDEAGLIVLTSDHGNLEDLSTRRHTLNPVPALVIGAEAARQAFADDLCAITDISPRIIKLLGGMAEANL